MAQRRGHHVHLFAQLFISERAGGAFFDFRLDGKAIVDLGAGVFIEHVVHDVHFAADAPARPRFAFTKIDNLRVRSEKLNVEVAQHRVPKPCNVGGRATHQLVVGAELVLVDEALQIRLRDEFRCRVPDKFAAELKLAHRRSVGVFQL